MKRRLNHRSLAERYGEAAELFKRKATVAGQFEKVDAERATLLEELASIDSQIAKLIGNVTVSPAANGSKAKTEEAAPVATEAAPETPEAPKQRRKRAKNKQALHVLIQNILNENPDGLELADIVTKCRQAGYKSNTKGDFADIVYQCLYTMMKDKRMVRHDKRTKLYRLRASARKAA